MENDINDSIIATNHSKIKNSSIKKDKNIQCSKVEIKVYWYAAGAGFLGGILASIIANIII